MFFESLSTALGPRQTDDEEFLGPTYQFKAHPDQQVQSMLTTNNFLVTGTCGEIAGWDWKSATSSKSLKIKPSWVVQIPSKKYKYILYYPALFKIFNTNSYFFIVEIVLKNQMLIAWCIPMKVT